MIVEMAQQEHLEGEIDRSGALMTTAQVLFENFEEGRTGGSTSVENTLQSNRKREAKICPQQEIMEKFCSRAQFEILRDLLIRSLWSKRGRGEYYKPVINFLSTYQ
jgi:hypothetical protein